MMAMGRLSRNDLADAILNAPGWARVGLTVRDERARLKAADAMAASIFEVMEDTPSTDARQLWLPIGGV